MRGSDGGTNYPKSLINTCLRTKDQHFSNACPLVSVTDTCIHGMEAAFNLKTVTYQIPQPVLI